MSKENRIISAGLTGSMLELVANVVEVKGQGVLFLGTGKSPSSVFLALLYKDTFVIADDYCNILKIDKIWYPKLRRFYRIREHDFEDFQQKDKSEVLGTAWKYAPGYMRNPLRTHLTHNEEIRSELERASHIPPMDERPATFEEYQAQKLREIRLHSQYIDTMAQRMAHKNWTQINYVFFLLPGILEPKYIRDYFSVNQAKLEAHFKARVKEYYHYIANVLFENRRGELHPKKNTFFIETNPEKQVMLATLCKELDWRGDDWTILFSETDLIFGLGFYYDSMLDKVRALYDLIEPPFRIYDYQEQTLKHITKEEWEENR